VLSYVYQQKTSKAIEFGRKAERVQSLIKDKFESRNSKNFVETLIEREEEDRKKREER